MNSRLFAALAMVWGIALPVRLPALILNVPDDYETIQAGIDASEDGDTVLVQPGLYEENLAIDGSLVLGSLTLTTGDPAYIDSTVIDGRQQGSVITVNGGDNGELLIRGFTIRNGLTSGNGGGVCCTNYDQIQLDDLLITGNVADDGFWAASGGGLSAREVSSISLNRVRIIGNSIQGNGGGGAEFREVDAAVLTDCIIKANQSNYMGGGIYDYHCNIEMTRVLIAQNAGGWNAGGGLMHIDGGSAQMDHVTFAYNSARNYAAAFYGLFDQGSFLTNSIIYGNQSEFGGDVIHLDGPLDITYCDIEGGKQSIEGDLGDYDSNIAQDPSFIDSDNGDYRISDNSPCIDAGDPDAEPDLDGSRTDMGAYPFAPDYRAFLGGQVLDSEFELPISGASVSGHYGRRGFPFQAESDSLGVWGGWFRSYFLDAGLEFQLDFTAEGYLQSSVEAEVGIDDSVWIETRLDHGEFLSIPDSLAVEADSGGSIQIPATIRNDGNGPLTWQALARARGDAGYTPWLLRQRLPVGKITGDDRIEGVIFDGESYYCAGANGDDPSMIYQINRQGELRDFFPQPGHNHYGFKDLEWDGELIWGSGEDTVYAINRGGEVIHRWRGPLNATTNIAYDPDEGVFWLSGITTNISAYDREGHYLDRTFDHQELFIDGLAWFADDPDSACLYALNTPDPDSSQISKFNTHTGEMRFVSTISSDSSTGLNSTFICSNFDRYQSWVMMTIANISPNSGGDQLRIWQLQPNSEWLAIDPYSGVVPVGAEFQVSVSLRTTAGDGDWAFALGEYDGEIVFTHDGFGGETILPVHLTVVEPNAAPGRIAETPDSFGIVSIYPNPFNATVVVGYRLTVVGEVSLRLYDVTGRLVKMVVDGEQMAGKHRAVIDGSSLASGVYLARLEAAGKVDVRKVVCVK